MMFVFLVASFLTVFWGNVFVDPKFRRNFSLLSQLEFQQPRAVVQLFAPFLPNFWRPRVSRDFAVSPHLAVSLRLQLVQVS